MLEEFEHTDNVNETGIIQRLQKGDKNAFTVLYRKYNKLIYTIAYRYLKNNEMSEDIVQHTFLKLWETKSLLQENMSIRNYLYTLAKNQVLNEIRNHTTAIEKNYNLLQDKSEIEDSLSKHIEDKDMIEVFRSILRELPHRQQQVCSYRLEKGLSIVEVAEKMKISIPTVKSLYQMGIKSIRLKMGKLLLYILILFSTT